MDGNRCLRTWAWWRWIAWWIAWRIAWRIAQHVAQPGFVEPRKYPTLVVEV
jgi:hypothetical protein